LDSVVAPQCKGQAASSYSHGQQAHGVVGGVGKPGEVVGVGGEHGRVVLDSGDNHRCVDHVGRAAPAEQAPDIIGGPGGERITPVGPAGYVADGVEGGG